MRILVTGASGLLGLNFCLSQMGVHEIFGIANQTRLKGPPFPIIYSDLTDHKLIVKNMDQVKPDLVVNCAAMANVDQCERSPLLAEKINAHTPGLIAEECLKRSVQMIHISTDAVFDGTTGNYREYDLPNPLSVYAKTKLDGERNVIEANPGSLVVRVNFFGFSVSGNRSLAEFFLNNLQAGKEVSGFTDIHFSPLYVRDLVEILVEMADRQINGTYHVVSCDHLSKYDFGIRISKMFSLDGGLISPSSYLKSGLLATRSQNLVLNIDKLLSTGIKVPNVAVSVDHFYKDYEAGLCGLIKSFGIPE